MIRINLLPKTAVSKAGPSNLRNQAIVAGVVVLVSLIGIAIMPNFGFIRINNQIEQLDKDIKKADEELKEVQEAQKLLAEIKENNRKIEEKVNIIKGLENKRTGPVWLMDEMTDAVSRFCVSEEGSGREHWKYLDNKVFIQKFSVAGGQMNIEGMALNNTYLVAFLNNLKFKKDLFSNVVLYYSDQTNFEKAVVRKYKITATVNLAAKPESHGKSGSQAGEPTTCSVSEQQEAQQPPPPQTPQPQAQQQKPQPK